MAKESKLPQYLPITEKEKRQIHTFLKGIREK